MTTYDYRKEPVDGRLRWVVLRRTLATEERIAWCRSLGAAYLIAQALNAHTPSRVYPAGPAEEARTR